MSHDTTLDTEAVDLGPAAREVVETYRAAPSALVGAALRRVRLRPTSAGRPGASSQPTSEGGFVRPAGWRFGWGAAGKLWTAAPGEPAATTPSHEPPRASAHNIFDLASLTKPVTALLLARLQREGVIHRDQKLGEVVPTLADSASGGVSLDLLSSHRSGLIAHREFFVRQANAVQATAETIIVQAADARRPECQGVPPDQGFEPVYSDLGYMLLGKAMETVTGRRLDVLVAEHVARPLGLTLGSIDQLGNTEPLLRQRLVPTEDVPWRGGVLCGVVHDENAWLLADGGMAGHAGAFGDIWSVVRLGTSILDAWSGRKDRWLRREDLSPLLRRRPGGSHCAGFDSRSPAAGDVGEGPASGAYFGHETFGHLGFTGTSLWFDLERELVGVLLTNRVHPSRDNQAIRKARPAVYDALYEALIGR